MNVKVLRACVVVATLIAACADTATKEPSISVGDVLLASGGTRINEHLVGLARDGRALPENERVGPWACYPPGLGDSLRVLDVRSEEVYRIAVISGVERGCEGWVLHSAFAAESELRGPVIDSVAAERAGRIAYEAVIASCLSRKPGRTRADCAAIYQRRRDSLNRVHP